MRRLLGYVCIRFEYVFGIFKGKFAISEKVVFWGGRFDLCWVSFLAIVRLSVVNDSGGAECN